MWRNRFGGGFGPVVRQTAEWMNVLKWWLGFVGGVATLHDLEDTKFERRPRGGSGSGEG